MVSLIHKVKLMFYLPFLLTSNEKCYKILLQYHGTIHKNSVEEIEYVIVKCFHIVIYTYNVSGHV